MIIKPKWDEWRQKEGDVLNKSEGRIKRRHDWRKIPCPVLVWFLSENPFIYPTNVFRIHGKKFLTYP